MRKVLLLAAATIATVGVVNAEFKPLDAATQGRIAVVLNENLPANLGIGKVAVDSAMIDVENSKLKLDMNAAYGYVPELAGYNATVKSKVAMMFDKPYSVEVTVGGVPVERLYSDAGYSYVRKSEKAPFVYALDKMRHPKKGLDGKVIAMWQSHGFYFEPKLNRWEWQRARIFQTVEDLYTQSFVMPYLMPMLENAGAYVMSPRERDTRRAELIVDNNGGFAAGAYAESNGTRISRIRSATAPSVRLRRQRAKTHRPLRGRPTYPRQGRMPSTFPTPLFRRAQRKPSTPFTQPVATSSFR